VNLQVGPLVGEVRAKPPPPRVTLVTALSYHAGSDNVGRGAGHGMISLPIDLGGRATSCWNTEWHSGSLQRSSGSDQYGAENPLLHVVRISGAQTDTDYCSN
jgi:hypothetical protein